MQSIVTFVQKLGAQRLAAMGAVTLTLIGFFAFVMLRLSQPRMAPLFAELGPAESSAVVRELETRGVKYELKADGALVMAPQEAIARLRMDSAAKGLPGGASLGYELFDKSDAFTTTATVQNLNRVRALEGELARSIRTIDRVQGARVHLSIPERRLFQKDKIEARASIVLKVRGELDAAQVRAIRHLVASAVDGLRPGRVSLVDESGRLLADGAGDETDTASIAAERQTAQEKRIRSEVEDIVASVVGRGRARVQVSVDLDHNKVQQTSEAFDPESRVIRSTQTRTEQNLSNDGRDTQVSVANELPGGQRRDGAANGPREQGQKNEEIVNYEISRTTRTETLDSARVKRLSVAVLVDGVYTKAASGEMAYAPRPEEELQRIGTLVRLGVGFDKARGDQVEIVNLRFAEQPATGRLDEPSGFARLLSFSQDDVMRLAETGVFAAISLVVLFFVVRPLLRQVTAPPLLETVFDAPPQLAAPGGGAAPALQAPGAPPALAASQPPALEQLGQLVASRPQEAAAILKTWMRSET